MKTLHHLVLGLSTLFVLGACGKAEPPADESTKSAEVAADKAPGADKAKEAAAAPAIKTDKGVDLTKKVIKVGALNAESGPAAPLGKPFALGKRIMAAQVNAGGLLPEGWTVEMVERDHGYNPQKSVQ